MSQSLLIKLICPDDPESQWKRYEIYEGETERSTIRQFCEDHWDGTETTMELVVSDEAGNETEWTVDVEVNVEFSLFKVRK